MSGLISTVVVLLALFRPGWLNSEWSMSAVAADPWQGRVLRVSRDNLPGAQDGEPRKLKHGQKVNERLLFEVQPGSSATHYELTVPASAWGKEGTCRFKIPAEMLVLFKE